MTEELTHKLKQAYLEGKGALNEGFGRIRAKAYPEALTSLTDILTRGLAGAFLPDNLALLAVGGYGRGQLCPYSDIDLLFLFRRPPVKNDLERVDDFLYPIWDLKLSSQPLMFALEQLSGAADSDFRTRTSVLSARLIWGDVNLYAQLQNWNEDSFKQPGRVTAFFEELTNQRRLRLKKFGSTPYLSAPQIKEGCGGQRDDLTLTWAFSALGVSGLGRAAEVGLLPPRLAPALPGPGRF